MNKLLTLFSVFFIIALVAACDNDSNNQDIVEVLTENDFAEDDTIRADFEEHNIVKFLEPPDSEQVTKDTGDTGTDIIPVSYTNTVEHTFCWEDDNEESEHFMELSDAEGSSILQLEVNNCITEIIQAGDYTLTLFHDGLSEDIHSIFLNRDDTLEQQAKNQPIYNYKLVKAAALNYLKNSIIKNARAQTVPDNIKTLMSTNKCVGCNFFRANLSQGQFFSADLRGANFFQAGLDDVRLDMANLSNASFEQAQMSKINLTGADLTNASMINANMTLSSLNDSNLTGADLSNANLSLTGFTGANISNANFTKADLTNAEGIDNAVSTNFSEATFTGVSLTGVTLEGSNFTDVDLSGIDLSGSNLIGANLTGAGLGGGLSQIMNTNLTGAIWCDGCVCGANSIGTCAGCSDQFCLGP